MQHRLQRSIRKAAEVTGIGFLTGADITVRFLPAPPNYGIALRRLDCPGSKPIPATIDFTMPRERRTAVGRDGIAVEMTEHVLSALAGLQIDNCLIELDGPEIPGCDGSSRAFVEALLAADVQEQHEPRALFGVEHQVRVVAEDGLSKLEARPAVQGGLTIAYQLDYGPDSPISPQSLSIEITPETYLNELATARTFVLESEVEELQAQGYGHRTTTRDLLVFGSGGLIDNQLRFTDECVRHKILDCLGDFALLGCDIHGHFNACRSGHSLNRLLLRRLIQTHSDLDRKVEANESACV